MDEMFYQIPEILFCHESFLEQLQLKGKDWHDKQKIGDIFVSSVSKSVVFVCFQEMGTASSVLANSRRLFLHDWCLAWVKSL